MKRRYIIIAGTGTDVGKTFIAGALIRGLSASHSVRYFKPVQTGHPDSDTATLIQELSTYRNIQFDQPKYIYSLAASPDQAAESELKPYPEIGIISDHVQAMNADINVIELAGGLHVPLNDRGETWLDFLTKEKIPVLLVASSGLGTLNHTALSLEALHLRGIPVIGIILNGPLHPGNYKSVTRTHPKTPVFQMPICTDKNMGVFLQNCSQLAKMITDTADDQDETNELAEAVKKHVWFPYCQHQTMATPLRVMSASGVWLELESGQKIIDGISSWWVNNIGHGRKEIGEAIYKQQQEIDHTIFSGMWHGPAARLAKSLTDISNANMSRVFFSDNGSTALEIALKIAFQSFTNKGQSGRSLFLSLKSSYHGDTFGAMSVSDSGGFHGHFKPLMFETKTIPPATFHSSHFCPEGLTDLAKRIGDFDQEFERNVKSLAGVVIEPLIMGAAGMLMQPPAYLQHISERCQASGIPLIVDEVFTGFGRTGAWFAFQRAGVQPDIVACAKGLTGGTMPLAATLAREEFFSAFLSKHKQKSLMHGHSYTANPIGCAAANAAIAIIQRERLDRRALKMESVYQEWIDRKSKDLRIEQPRTLGGVLAFEIPKSGPSDYYHKVAEKFAHSAIEEGLLLRPLGNTIYLMPPLSITDSELQTALASLERVVARI